MLYFVQDAPRGSCFPILTPPWTAPFLAPSFSLGGSLPFSQRAEKESRKREAHRSVWLYPVIRTQTSEDSLASKCLLSQKPPLVPLAHILVGTYVLPLVSPRKSWLFPSLPPESLAWEQAPAHESLYVHMYYLLARPLSTDSTCLRGSLSRRDTTPGNKFTHSFSHSRPCSPASLSLSPLSSHPKNLVVSSSQLHHPPRLGPSLVSITRCQTARLFIHPTTFLASAKRTQQTIRCVFFHQPLARL